MGRRGSRCRRRKRRSRAPLPLYPVRGAGRAGARRPDRVENRPRCGRAQARLGPGSLAWHPRRAPGGRPGRLGALHRARSGWTSRRPRPSCSARVPRLARVPLGRGPWGQRMTIGMPVAAAVLVVSSWRGTGWLRRAAARITRRPLRCGAGPERRRRARCTAGGAAEALPGEVRLRTRYATSSLSRCGTSSTGRRNRATSIPAGFGASSACPPALAPEVEIDAGRRAWR